MIKGRTVRHCKKGRKGKLIKRHRTHAAALRHHRAIMRSKKRRGKKKGKRK